MFDRLSMYSKMEDSFDIMQLGAMCEDVLEDKEAGNKYPTLDESKENIRLRMFLMGKHIAVLKNQHSQFDLQDNDHAKKRLHQRYRYKDKVNAVYRAFNCDTHKVDKYHNNRVVKLYNGYKWIFEDNILITLYRLRKRTRIT